MATLHAVIVPAKALKDDRHKIRISIAHNGETRYISTNIIINSSREFKNGTIIKRPDAAFLNTKIRGVLQHYQEEIDEIGYIEGLSCSELVFLLKSARKKKNHTLQDVFDEYIGNASIAESTRTIRRSTWRRISRYINTNGPISNFNRHNVVTLLNGLREAKIQCGTIKNDIAFLKSIITYATKRDYAHFRIDPFIDVSLPNSQPRDSWLTEEELKKIRDLKDLGSSTERCRDLFMLSYYLGGINMVDLCKINFDENPGVLKYVRQKTERREKFNKYVEFTIPDEAMEIINRYKDADGYLAMTAFERRCSFSTYTTYHMAKIAKITGLKQLVFYSARKSFGQHAYSLGISESVIDYILGHSLGKGGSSLFFYVYVTPEQATEAIRKVLDNLK